MSRVLASRLKVEVVTLTRALRKALCFTGPASLLGRSAPQTLPPWLVTRRLSLAKKIRNSVFQVLSNT